VKLCQFVIGYPSSPSMNPFVFDKTLNDKLMELIRKYSSGKPTLVFCSTRKSTTDACETLLKECQGAAPGTSSHALVSNPVAAKRYLN
jgi:ATP-dependent DNA helicase HFM1/MER3